MRKLEFWNNSLSHNSHNSQFKKMQSNFLILILWLKAIFFWEMSKTEQKADIQKLAEKIRGFEPISRLMLNNTVLTWKLHLHICHNKKKVVWGSNNMLNYAIFLLFKLSSYKYIYIYSCTHIMISACQMNN